MYARSYSLGSCLIITIRFWSVVLSAAALGLSTTAWDENHRNFKKKCHTFPAVALSWPSEQCMCVGMVPKHVVSGSEYKTARCGRWSAASVCARWHALSFATIRLGDSVSRWHVVTVYACTTVSSGRHSKHVGCRDRTTVFCGCGSIETPE